MKMFIPLMFLMSLALAEPPVGEGYPASRFQDHQQHDHHDSDHESLSQNYDPPANTIASARNAPSNGYDYNAPNARSSNLRGQSQHPPAKVRVSFYQRFGSAGARSSGQVQNTPGSRSQSQGYANTNARSGISQEYGPPESRSLSQEYEVPSIVAARTLSTEYGTPNVRSAPSEEYDIPAARNNQKPLISNFRSSQPGKVSQAYSAPATRSQFQSESHSEDNTGLLGRSNNAGEEHDAHKSIAQSSFQSRSAPSSTYGAPASRSLSTSYGVPSARSTSSHAEDEKDSSETYADQFARSLSQEYGVPSALGNLNTKAIASSYTAARSSPSSSYLPASRSEVPSEQYGVPVQRDGSNLGYESARASASDELLNQEPANYDFGYQIEDQESGSDFGHIETREENRAEGSYFVVLPDGSKQTVDYEADERGYKPRISVEPAAASGRSGSGYDENAAEFVEARTAGGPY